MHSVPAELTFVYELSVLHFKTQFIPFIDFYEPVQEAAHPLKKISLIKYYFFTILLQGFIQNYYMKCKVH